MSDFTITPEKIWPSWLYYWTRMSSRDISNYVANTPAEKQLVLIVWGTIESHGPYMPVANDSHLAALAADEVARRLHEDHQVQPIIFNGFINVGSPSATWQFPGAIGYTASPVPVIQTIWEQTLQRMVAEGFKKFFVVNGDGGNWLNHWPQLKWDSQIVRSLIKDQGVVLLGSNWDQEGGEPYVHAGEWDHALISWACKYAPEFQRLSALRHGLRAPDESQLSELEDTRMAWLEEEPYRTSDWSQYPGQHTLLGVTQFDLNKYHGILANNGAKARVDFETKISHLMNLVLRVVEGKVYDH